MGAGNNKSLSGGKAILAGTYVAEQMSPSTYTLVSATSGAKQGGKQNAEFGTKKRRQHMDLKDGSSYTVLPALADIEQVLSKEGQSGTAKTAAQEPKVDGMKKGNTTQVSERLYPAAGKKLASCFINDVLEKTDEELVAWLSKPRGANGNRDLSSEAKVGTMSKPSSAATLPSNDGRSVASSRSGRPHKHKTHYDLFSTTLRGIGASSSEAGVSPGRLYSPGKAAQKHLRPLADQIQPIVISSLSAVEALKASERQRAQRLGDDQSGWVRETPDVSSAPDPSSAYNIQMHPEKRKSLSSIPQKSRTESNAEAEPALKKVPASESSEQLGEKTIDSVVSGEKMPVARREAADALRIFIFGAEDLKMKERDKVFYEPCGSKEEVVRLWQVWCMIDQDRGGSIDISELRKFAANQGQQKVVDKIAGHLLTRKTIITVEDFMRIVWPCASLKEIKTMRGWIEEYDRSIKRVKTPPLLPQEEYEALLENFKWFDRDRSGAVCYSELVESGLLDKETAERYMEEWDRDGTGTLSKSEFCDMLCLAGYRAYPTARISTDLDGNQLHYEDGIGWHKKPVKYVQKREEKKEKMFTDFMDPDTLPPDRE